MENSSTSSKEQRLEAARSHAQTLVKDLQALTADAGPEQLPWLLDLIDQAEQVATFLAQGNDGSRLEQRKPTAKERREFGKLLRDRRNAAGLSRPQLASRAKLSDATIKFLETARHPPSRGTLIRLFAVAELKLTWADAPGVVIPPPPQPANASPELAPPGLALNCLITPTFDPVRRIAELGRFLNGAGGYVEQVAAYLDHQSAAAYLALGNQSATAVLRQGTPLAEAARQIVGATGAVPLQLIALGSGGAFLEVRLSRHLLEEGRVPAIELCLVDASQPLLACGQSHVAEQLADSPKARAWAMPCHFEELPLYAPLLARPGVRRVFCMLGNVLGDLENEPRFFEHSLPHCSRGDLLLLDMRLAFGTSAADSETIKAEDRQWSVGVTPAEAAWLGGPIWRHARDVSRVDFSWNLDTNCALWGSYALEAMATVQLRSGVERRFSMFRFRRHNPTVLASCLRGLGWEELDAMPFGGTDQPSSLRLFRKSRG